MKKNILFQKCQYSKFYYWIYNLRNINNSKVEQLSIKIIVVTVHFYFCLFCTQLKCSVLICTRKTNLNPYIIQGQIIIYKTLVCVCVCRYSLNFSICQLSGIIFTLKIRKLTEDVSSYYYSFLILCISLLRTFFE